MTPEDITETTPMTTGMDTTPITPEGTTETTPMTTGMDTTPTTPGSNCLFYCVAYTLHLGYIFR